MEVGSSHCHSSLMESGGPARDGVRWSIHGVFMSARRSFGVAKRLKGTSSSKREDFGENSEETKRRLGGIAKEP